HVDSHRAVRLRILRHADPRRRRPPQRNGAEMLGLAAVVTNVTLRRWLDHELAQGLPAPIHGIVQYNLVAARRAQDALLQLAMDAGCQHLAIAESRLAFAGNGNLVPGLGWFGKAEPQPGMSITLRVH